MSDGPSADRHEPSWKLAARAIFRLGLFALLFIAAGRVGWRQAWVLFGLILIIFAVNLIVIRVKNPGLLRERMKKDAPVKPLDKAIMGLALPLAAAVFVVAGLDAVRFGWSSVPVGWAYAGAALFLGGDIPIAWAMATNPYLERAVRIQDERGHQVVTAGPYRFVRHRMYVGVMVMCSGWPLVLGSLWAYLPVALLVVLLVVRTALEDRTLRDGLPGYREYAQRTRYRLLPGIW